MELVRVTFEDFWFDWLENHLDERLGQRFCNLFMKHPWPELYYMESDKEARKLIIQWLIDHCYYPYVPNRIK